MAALKVRTLWLTECWPPGMQVLLTTQPKTADIARMILASTEFMADAPEGDFDRSFADDILEDIAKQLREGADK